MGFRVLPEMRHGITHPRLPVLLSARILARSLGRPSFPGSPSGGSQGKAWPPCPGGGKRGVGGGGEGVRGIAAP